jgi:selenide,water dikinase
VRGSFPAELPPALLVGLDEPDDAAVYRLEGATVILTADYFPPVVDDAADYGAIAAANALSDVYAMGGRPVLALNLTGLPDDMPAEVAAAILRGGAEKVCEAGAVIGGGHTTRDEEPTYGLAVLGTVDPEALIRKSGARPGDALVLTKPLGTGVITTAGKQGAASADELAAAVSSMRRLNAAASAAAVRAEVHCGTDVTGFGLLGHGLELAEASGVRFRIRPAAVPLLTGAHRCGVARCFPGGAASNEGFFAPRVQGAEDAVPDPVNRRLLFSPETSGGLLLAVPAVSLNRFLREAPGTAVIGQVVEGEGIELVR